MRRKSKWKFITFHSTTETQYKSIVLGDTNKWNLTLFKWYDYRSSVGLAISFERDAWMHLSINIWRYVFGFQLFAEQFE